MIADSPIRTASLFLVLFAAMSSCSSREEEARVDGVVFFVVDTLRADHLTPYGYDRATSPHLDAFAEDALVFDNCRSQSTWTKPSTASILTGLYPSEHGADKETAAMPEAVVSLAERLTAAGVRTGSFYANSWLREKHGLQQGFGVSTFVPRETPERTAEVVRRALDFVRSSSDRPFFLYVHTVDPHAPYAPPEPFRAEFDSGVASQVDGSFGIEGRPVPPEDLAPGDVEHLVDLYDGEVRNADEGFGALLDGLSELGRADSTAVFFLADHGEEFGDHGGWHHGPMMFDEVLRIPLLAHRPSLDPALRGTHVPELALQVDLAPTVLALFGIPIPRTLPGRDLFGLPAAPPTAGRLGISEVDSAGISRRAVTGRGLKYVRAWSPSAHEFLYDLAADPGETTDLMASEPDRAAEHRAALESFLARTGSGLFVLFQNGGTALLTVECILFHGPEDPEVRGLYTEEMVSADRPQDGLPEVHEAEWEGRVRRGTRVLLRVEPGDADGLHILPPTSPTTTPLELLVRLDGESIDSSYVRLGAGEGTPGMLPFGVRLPLDPALASPPFPAHTELAGDPYRLRIWTGAEDSRTLEFSQDEIEAFRALGYMGEE